MDLTFFRMSTLVLALALALLVGGAATVGTIVGRRLRARPEPNHVPVGVVQAALLGLIGLVLAFGLTMAVGRYDNRRAIVVQEANDITTTYLRAQLISEPSRAESLDLLRQLRRPGGRPGRPGARQRPVRRGPGPHDELQRALWGEAGDAVRTDPTGTAPRLYIESLNEMFDSRTDHVTSLRNRVPSTVVLLQVLGGAVAVGALSLYLALLGRGLLTSLVAATVVFVILFISARPRPAPSGPHHRAGRAARHRPGHDGRASRRHSLDR